jgi:hypothetical protein
MVVAEDADAHVPSLRHPGVETDRFPQAEGVIAGVWRQRFLRERNSAALYGEVGFERFIRAPLHPQTNRRESKAEGRRCPCLYGFPNCQ